MKRGRLDFAFFDIYAYSRLRFSFTFLGWTNISGIEAEQRGASRKDIPAERAELILKKMKDSRLDIQPGAYTYNHILDCVSFLLRKIVLPKAKF
jgi:hypothetical protein